MIDRNNETNQISIKRQCELLNIQRSGLYYTPSVESNENLQIMRLLDEQYMKTPFYGCRKLAAVLKQSGYNVNRKRVQRLMKLVRWQTLYRRVNTSRSNDLHEKYPYLLRDLEITHANQVWAIDITYIPMPRGYMYLCGIIDLKTRYLLHWGLSNTMSSVWCQSVVEEAISKHGYPEIINSDQGSQFTSKIYTDYIKSLPQEVKISMDGKGRATDNAFIERLWRSLKYECIYLNAYENCEELHAAIEEYFRFYNEERVHQSLNYTTPAMNYKKIA